jgi:hypothetical protein
VYRPSLLPDFFIHVRPQTTFMLDNLTPYFRPWSCPELAYCAALVQGAPPREQPSLWGVYVADPFAEFFVIPRHLRLGEVEGNLALLLDTLNTHSHDVLKRPWNSV